MLRLMENADLGAELVSRSEFTEQMQMQEQISGSLFGLLNLNAGGLSSGATTTAAAAAMMEKRRDNPPGGGVVTGGHLPALGEVEITSGSGYSSLDVGPREFGSLKHAVPKFDGSSADFPLWNRHFETFALMAGRVQYFRSVTTLR